LSATIPSHLAANVDRFTGFADRYDAFRPQPPSVLLDILTQLARVERPRLVVDLGSGTGLSTVIWSARAERVIGVEPNADMRRQALVRAAQTGVANNVKYIDAVSSQTGLPDASADIVTCSQSLHWMDPAPTFAEVARILRPGGVFAAYDADWPPTLNWQAERAYTDFVERAEALGEARGWYNGVIKWKKEEHLVRMSASGHFRYVKEIVVHHAESGDAERLIGLALSQGGVAKLLQRGASESEMGLDTFRREAARALGDRSITWYFSYRVRLGIK
jgi:ubiquinone/menaquinone biosynthesis C-methylase UbiE